MSQTSDYALLSADAYRDARLLSDNYAPIPTGWSELTEYAVSGSGPTAPTIGNGFSARVYKNGGTGEIVISYAGTQFGGSVAGQVGDWGAGNGPLALGIGSTQATDAADLYQRVLAKEGSDITFTGHSLGGGLAAMMAVYFDRPAKVFAPAPFSASADATQYVTGGLGPLALIRIKLFANGVADPSLGGIPQALADYSPAADYVQRSQNVLAWAVDGEVLEQLSAFSNFGFIEGSSSRNHLLNLGQTQLDATSKHSIDLHAAALLSPLFNEWASKLTTLLPRIFDSELYLSNLISGDVPDFMVKLNRNEVGVEGLAANGMLSHFANDLQKLGTDLSGLNEAAQNGLIAQGIEWYYWQGTDYAGQEFSTRSGALLQYSTAQGDNLPGAQKKAELYVTPWLTEVSLAHGTTLFPNFGTQQQWNVATAATTAVVATAREQDESQIFIGRGGADTFTGGHRADVIFAGAGNDTLNGGQGNDALYGGDGNDTYQFTGLWGKDLIADTDGSGSIQIDGQTLGAAKGAGKLNTWVAELGAGSGVYVGMTVYDDARSSTGKRLVIVKGGDTSNSITIDHFDLAKAQQPEGYLGIQLDPARQIVVKEAAGGINTWSDARFEASSLAGQGSSVVEGGAKTFTVYLNQAAQAGETLTLSLGSLGDKFKALITPAGGGAPSVVNAQGAVITLAAGQTQVSFALVQEGEVSADASAQLSVSYQPAQDSPVQSNAWAINLQDAGALGQTQRGDQRAEIINAAGNYDWASTSWGADGTLNGGVAEANFSDVLRGGAGNDQLSGLGGNDAIDGGAGNDTLEGGDGDDMMGGGAGSDTILGGAGNDYINTSATLSVMQRRRPDDSWSPPAGRTVLTQGALWGVYLDTEADGDPVTIWSGSNSPSGADADVVDGGDGDDRVIAGGGDDQVDGGAGDDEIEGMGGGDVLRGGAGDDTINGDGIAKAGYMNSLSGALHGSDFIDGGAGNDVLRGGGGDDVVSGGADNDYLYGDANGNSSDADTLQASYHGRDQLDGGAGDDYLEGGGNDDRLYGGDGKDNLWGDTDAAKVDTPEANAVYWGGDFLDGGEGDDQLSGGGRNDTLLGGAGDDAMWGDQQGSALAGEYHGEDLLYGEAGHDYMEGGGKDDILYGGAGNDTMHGDDEANLLAAEFQGADYLDGGEGDDYLSGGGGNDALVGGAGKNTLLGGMGDDLLMGGEGNDFLDGGAGADVMIGGAGDDTYLVDDEGDVIVDLDPPGSGTGGGGAPGADSVTASVSYTLGSTLENLTLTGTGNIDATGNAGRNLLFGNDGTNRLSGGAGDDQLSGGKGADVLIGGTGDDVYVVDEAAATVVEAASEGNDTVLTTVSYTLASEVERIQAQGTGDINLSGNALDNSLIGNSGNNALTGGQGMDFLMGGAGNDVYVFNRGDGEDTIANTDFLRDTADASKIQAVDVLRFGAGIAEADVTAVRSGDSLVLRIRGTTDQVWVNNHFGAEQTNGTQVQDHRIDQIQFASGAVWDQARIQVAVDAAANNQAPVYGGGIAALQARAALQFSYTLPVSAFADPDAGDALVYSARLTDGSALPAWLSFDATTRTLSGTPGATEVGTLSVAFSATDGYGASISVAVPLTVQTNRAPTLSAALPDQAVAQNASFLISLPSNAFSDPDAGDSLRYSATLADGSPLPSWLTFNSESLSFSGLSPAQSTFNIQVTATDAGGSSVSGTFGLVATALIEGTAGDDLLVGAAGNDTLRGLAGNDTLDGGLGTDTMLGGLGNDTYLVDDANDLVIEAMGEGVDQVISTVSFVLGANVENLTLTGTAASNATGNSAANVLTGNSAGNTLDGAGGADTMRGGAGNDVYVVDNAGDVVIELASQGEDLAQSSVSYSLSANVENLTLTGAGSISATGNDQVNILTGNAGNNVLDGAGGADTMRGGAGDDSYIVDDENDVVAELANEGTDSVQSSVSHTLSANVDNLTLTGTAAISGSGNSMNNVIAGNDADNVLAGGDGDDSLQGAQGEDTLLGGAGDDVLYGDEYFNIAQRDYLDGGDGNDRLYGGSGDVLVGGSGDDTYYHVPSGSPAVYLTNGAYSSAVEIVESVAEGVDTFVTKEAKVKLADHVENLTVSAVGNPTLWYWVYGVEQQDLFSTYQDAAIASHGYEEGTVSFSQSLVNDYRGYFIGNSSNNTIDVSGAYLSSRGLGALIDGGSGADTMIGGSENTTYVVDDAGDVVVEGALGGGSQDVVTSSRVSLSAISGIEVLELAGTLALSLTGDAGNNDLRASKNTAANQLTGGGGDDTYFVDLGDLVVEAVDGGNDTVVIDLMATGAAALHTSGTSITLAEYANVENLAATGIAGGNGGAAGVRLVGNADNNRILGSSHDDWLYGGDGDDYLQDSYVFLAGAYFSDTDWMDGGSGNDTLVSRRGNDTLVGGGGNDTLNGGSGSDMLAGGAGDDIFLFNSGDGHDIVDESVAGSVPTSIGSDILRLGPYVMQADVVLRRSGNDLLVSFDGVHADESDSIRWVNGLVGTDVQVSAKLPQRIEFSDGTAWDAATIFSSIQGLRNQAPTVQTALPATTVDEDSPWSYTVPLSAFSDADAGDTLTYSASLADGSALPWWLTFDAETRTFSGTPLNEDIGLASIRVTATDIYGVSAQQAFDLLINNTNDAPISAGGIYPDDAYANLAYSFELPEYALYDPDAGDVLTYTVSLADGSALPSWLSFDAATRTLAGTPPAGTSTNLALVVTATDSALSQAEVAFELTIKPERQTVGTVDSDTFTGTTAIDVMYGRAGDDVLLGMGGNDRLFGESGDDWLEGGEGADTLVGGTENDTLIGGDGNDSLLGDAGQDLMIGGGGDDYYAVDSAGDTIIENANEGNEMVRATVSWTLDANLERLAVDGTGDLLVGGNSLDNGLWGNSGSNILTGGLGNDFLSGGQGNDVYVFNRGDGQDTIDNLDVLGATDTLWLGAGILETDVSAFQSGSSLFFGIRGGADRIAISNYFAANTTLAGLAADRKIDQVEFASGAVWDQAMIQTMVDRATNNRAPTVTNFPPTLQARAGSVFSFTVAANAITDPDPWDGITYSVKMPDGSAVPAWLSFDPTSRTLSGTPGTGNVGTLQFVLWGTDNYGSSAGAYVNMTIGAANRAPVLNTVLLDQAASQGATFSYTVPAGAFTDPDSGDVLTFSATLADGSALPSWLSFNASTRVFSGTPTSTGSLSVRVTARDGSSLSVSDVFDLVVTVQNLVLNGTASADTLSSGVGNDTLNGLAGNDILNSGAGDDLLDGGAGNDTMNGGAGNDTYVVDATADIVTEAANAGTDLVRSTVSYTLGANVENLTLTGTAAINATGNTLNNVLTGNSGANILSGGAGADTMLGGLGNDTYVVDDAGDVVVENANEGTDLVQSSVSYALGAHVENLTLTGTAAINATGNAVNNTLTGNGGNNILDGGAGNDTLVGGAGNDTYYVDSTSDVITEAASAGTDTVISSVSWTLATNLENLTLAGTANINGTGNTVTNVIIGNAGNNVLSGGAGADTMVGGAGNDTYVVDVATDVLTENLNEGVDLVQSSVTYTLGANVENLTLTGTTGINGTGNGLDNVLTGNSANNTLTGGAGNDWLDGAAGNDTMVGGTGDDTYVVNATGDIVTELAGQGIDTVRSGVTYTLGSNVENLILTGTANRNGTGNTLDNLLTGNSGVNTLSGGAGNDTLDGGAGADSLVGGTGNDTYWLGRGYGIDTITENDATAGNTDVARFEAGIAVDQLWFAKSGNNLNVSIIGTTDRFTLTNWYLGNQYHVEQFKTSDGKTLLDSQVQNLVSAMAAFSPPAAGQTTLSASQATALAPVIAANWQ